MSVPALSATIVAAAAGCRYDRALAMTFPQFSRSQLQRWLADGLIHIDGKPPQRQSGTARGGEHAAIIAVPEAPAVDWQPTTVDTPFKELYVDDDIIIIDKPAGLVVHPAPGHADDTLINALLARYPTLEQLPRAGVVHRIDKDTSGLLCVCRSATAHRIVTEMLAEHAVTRLYDAVCIGVPVAGGDIDAPLGRHRLDRRKQVVRTDGKPAFTSYRVVSKFRRHALLRVQLRTGRTHQIRVHMAHIGYPLVGDSLYGARMVVPPAADATLVTVIRHFRRQALHAASLMMTHPVSGRQMQWQSPLPEDMVALINVLTTDMQQ